MLQTLQVWFPVPLRRALSDVMSTSTYPILIAAYTSACDCACLLGSLFDALVSSVLHPFHVTDLDCQHRALPFTATSLFFSERAFLPLLIIAILLFLGASLSVIITSVGDYSGMSLDHSSFLVGSTWLSTFTSFRPHPSREGDCDTSYHDTSTLERPWEAHELITMNKQSSQTLDNVTDSTEIPSTLSAAQGWADKASSTRKGHIESHSELSIESSCFLELAEKTTYQSVELKATVDAALPVVEFLSLDDPVSALALTTDTCHQTHASLESLQLLAVLLSKVIRQLTIETIRATFFLVIRTKESVGATIRVFHADIKLLVSISVVWIHVGFALVRIVSGVLYVLTGILVLHISTSWREGRLLPGFPSQASLEHLHPGEGKRRPSRNGL